MQLVSYYSLLKHEGCQGVVNMRSGVLNRLLSKLDIHPVLIDIGASGAPPKIWEEIAQHSVYIGFDPDLREIHEVPESRFHKWIIVNEAITSNEGRDEVLFYFTNSPYCSSTLKPDSKSLSNFLFSDLFVVEREAKVRATTLDSVMERLSLPYIDWLNTDSQGTDLRIFDSLKPEVRSRVLAVDIEPGLVSAYVGEDLFVEAHKDLTQNGFWLSDLSVHGSVRIKRSTMSEVMAFNKDITPNLIKNTVRESPGWVNARYFRTIEWLAQGDSAKRDYVLLWVFALLDNQLGFALDLGIEYENVFGRDEVSLVMKDEPILHIRRSRQVMRFAGVKSLPIRIMRLFKKLG